MVAPNAGKPGSLMPIQGAYNFRDLGGYKVFYDMYKGRALGTYRDINDAISAFNKVRKPDGVTTNPDTAAIEEAFLTMNAALKKFPSISTALGAAYNNGAGIANLPTLMKEAWVDLAVALADEELHYHPAADTDDARTAAATASWTWITAGGSSPNRELLSDTLHAIAGKLNGEVKRGLIYRSGDLSTLTDRDIGYIKNSLGVKAVIDFRGIANMDRGGTEQTGDKDRLNFAQHGILAGLDKDPHPLTANAIAGHLQLAYPGTGDTYFSGDHLGVQLNKAGEVVFGARFAIEEGVVGTMDTFLGPDNSAQEAANQMIKGYKEIIRMSVAKGPGSRTYTQSGVVQYANFFRYLIYVDGDNHNALRETAVPVIFHCSAGKDRTGMAAALFYSALGVPRETIIDDYMLSAKYVKDKYAAVENALGAQMSPLVSVRREYIQSFFNYIDGIADSASGDRFAHAATGKVYPGASYDASASVIKFLITPIGNADNAVGLGLTLEEIYHLRKLYVNYHQ
ncbi:MAG: hypothetical protein Ta2A_14020 [Treponemataceae bacterium]|nr:MAG: hypothetical protein Ta2A_14020 [Treponemataceae bacterium]